MDIITLAAAMAYVKKTAAALGAVKGAPCTVKSIQPITGGNRVTFEWTGTNGQVETGTMDVMDGAQGATGDTGAKGDKGDTGADGVSPVITITDIAGGHRITITDAQHPQGQSFDVMDGDAGSVTWANITGKPSDLVQDADYNHTDNNFTDADKTALENAVSKDNLFIAEYNVTTAQEIIEFINGTHEPCTPMLVKRGTDYYTVITATKMADNRAIIRTFATLSGVFYIFTYDITNATWANNNYGVQRLLISGTDIKTINGQSLLGAGDINTDEDTGWQTLTGDYFDVSYRKKNGVVYVTWHRTEGVKQAFEAKVPVTNCTFPEGFRPTRNAYTMLVAPSAWNHGYAGVQTGGAMRVCFQNAIAQGAETMFGSLSYPV